jgi:hypothetical protein
MRKWLPVATDDVDRDVLVPLLLAAFVIVVGSFLGTALLDMERTPTDEEYAGATIDVDRGDESILVTYRSMERPETELDVTVYNATTDDAVASVTLTSVGQRFRFGSFTDGHEYEVVVVAVWQGQRVLVTRRTATF